MLVNDIILKFVTIHNLSCPATAITIHESDSGIGRRYRIDKGQIIQIADAFQLTYQQLYQILKTSSSEKLIGRIVYSVLAKYLNLLIRLRDEKKV